MDQRDKEEALMGEEDSSEAMLFARLFRGDSGVRFNFDEARVFLRDPHIALIASDLTVDENLDNIERLLDRIRRINSMSVF
ncbi:unnamed protein product [Gongylonema pulchrum]|uniref:Dynein light chain n=1 Tax=Gongylonema pulchrum TaxID=637853 RepID=A0A183DVW6_9BILA|nr:unnamed protein product [Gongylonema pulchrum]